VTGRGLDGERSGGGPRGPMERRDLGRSGLRITRLGVGSWALGGSDWKYGPPGQVDADSIGAILRAVELGVNWIDTAALYGLGHSEEIVGEALRRLPAADRPMVFTKCGVLWNPADPYAEPWNESSPASVRRECEASLRRLGLERIDLLQIHWPDETGVPVEETWGEMARLVDEGKVRAIGVSNFDVPLLERCEAVRHVDSLQPSLSLLRREAGAALIPWCAAHGTGVITYSPMASGVLTDTFSRARVAAMAPDDWRRGQANLREPALSANLALLERLRPVAARHSTTISAIAVAWVLAWPDVTGAIVGARRPSQPDGWIGAAGLRLTHDDLDEIAAAIEASGAGSGPARPGAAA
jgi:aryl-alcohol dehydrogenase-like predicted oxidoreductase